MKRLIRVMAATAALSMVSTSVVAQTTPKKVTSTALSSPQLTERKMTDDELLAYRNGVGAQGPSAVAGARSVGPATSQWVAQAAGKKVDPRLLGALTPPQLRMFVDERHDNIATLRDRMQETMVDLRRAMDRSSEFDPAIDANYASLHRDVEALENEVANIEAAHAELEEFDDLAVLDDMDKRLKRARVHVRMMERSKDRKEFEAYASTLTTALGIIAQQTQQLASR